MTHDPVHLVTFILLLVITPLLLYTPLIMAAVEVCIREQYIDVSATGYQIVGYQINCRVTSLTLRNCRVTNKMLVTKLSGYQFNVTK